VYAKPPLLLYAQKTTNAAANTPTNGNLLAAPGGGFAYRVVGLHLAPQYSNAGAGQVQVRRGGAADLWVLSWVGAAAPPDVSIPEPGYQLPENEPLAFLDVAAVVNQVYNLTVLYFLDPV
jgi:hypothetical protein